MSMFHLARRPAAEAARALSLSLSLSLSFSVLAADTVNPPVAAPTTAGPDAPALTLGQVVITASPVGPLSSRRIFTSVDVVAGETLQARSVDQAWELFNAVPGVMLTEFRQGTTSGKLSLRGFNGEGNINAVKLLIDGVPSNTNDGNMPYLDMVSPLEIERIEVVRGTNDPRWGLHAIAGHAQIVTRQGGDEGQARISIGSFGTAEMQLARGFETESGWSQNYFLGYRRSSGHRDHAEADKQSLSGKWFYQQPMAGWRAGLIARSYDARAEEPGYLTLAQREADPGQSPSWNGSDEGRRRMNQLSLHAEGEARQGLSWVTRAWRNQIDDHRFVKFSASASQQERIVLETHRGLLGSLTWRASPAFQLEGGLQREWQDNASLRYLSANQVRSSQTRDQSFSLDSVGGYVQAVIKPAAQWTLLPAWRVDQFSGQMVNRLNGQVGAINDYGAIQQPKFSLAYAPGAGQSVYANWGRSFQIGVGAASYLVPPRTTDLTPSINQGWELGWKFRLSDWLEGRVASWTQIASDEVYRKLNDPSNDSANLGRTRRDGQDLQFNVKASARLSAWASLSLQRAVIVDPDPAAPLTRGKEVDHVPHALASVGARWQPMPEWAATVGVRAQSSYHLEQTNTAGRYGQFVVADLALRHQCSPQVSLDMQVKNLFDRRYEYAWWDGTQSLHAPADGRAVTLSAQVRF